MMMNKAQRFFRGTTIAIFLAAQIPVVVPLAIISFAASVIKLVADKIILGFAGLNKMISDLLHDVPRNKGGELK